MEVMQIVLLAAAAAIYFLPTLVARLRRHQNTIPIFLVNLVFGLVYGVGWVIALIWAFTDNTAARKKEDERSSASAIAQALHADSATGERDEK